MTMRSHWIAAMAAVWMAAAGADAGAAQESTGNGSAVETAAGATLIETAGKVSAVSIHGGSATVTRRVEIGSATGELEIRVTELPAGVRTDSFRTRTSEGVTVEGVEFTLTEPMSTFRQRRSAFEAARAPLLTKRSEFEEQLQVLAKEEALYDGIAARVANTAAEGAATSGINTVEVAAAAKFLGERQADVLKRRREATAGLEEAKRAIRELEEANEDLLGNKPARRPAALVRLNVTASAAGTGMLELSYEVGQVAWRPAYSLRTAPDGSTSTLEYGAVITQSTGEDWVDVAMELSTTAMLSAAKPPAVDPWWVEVKSADGTQQAGGNDAAAESGATADGQPALPTPGDQAQSFSGEIPMTSFRISQPVTVLSGDGDAGELPQEVAITTIRGTPNLKYYAAPLVCEFAFLRGTMQNSSRMHLLPGPVRLFLGNEFTGEAMLGYTAPGRRFETFFGVDKRVAVDRRVMARKTRITGILQDGVETQVEYRLLIANNSGQAIQVELWDRSPATKDSQIRISVTGLSDNLSSDDAYRAEERTEGLLRWDLEVGAAATTGRERSVDYTVVVAHRRDVQTTDLPE